MSIEPWYKVARSAQVCLRFNNFQSVSDLMPSLTSLTIHVLSFFHPSSEAYSIEYSIGTSVASRTGRWSKNREVSE
jgi:hypothetical protein